MSGSSQSHSARRSDKCGDSQRMTIVTVTFNSSAVLPRMLNSIPHGVPAIIVDNGSRDAETILKIAKRNNVKLIRNQENLGFGRACNLGAAEAETELVLFMNPDAVICDGALEWLAAAAENYSEASAFNPVIEYPDGRLFFRGPSRIAPKRIRYRRGLPDHDMEMPVLSGAALLVRKADFRLSERFRPEYLSVPRRR